MLINKKGNIWNTEMDNLCIPVNLLGVMGKGLALQAKKQCPGLFNSYKKFCDRGEIDIGYNVYWESSDYPKGILLLATKIDWRYPSRVEYVKEGLIHFAESYEKWGIKSIAFPRLGCGAGGLDWINVEPLFTQIIKPLPIDIEIYQ